MLSFRENNKFPIAILLTNRETAIVRLICREYSNKQIAAELHLSPYTVEDHKKNIRRKMRVLTVVGVVMYAMNNHLLVQTFLMLVGALGMPEGGEVFTGDCLE
jgi:DNA-binding NarL/FixJ family response regulator